MRDSGAKPAPINATQGHTAGSRTLGAMYDDRFKSGKPEIVVMSQKKHQGEITLATPPVNHT